MNGNGNANRESRNAERAIIEEGDMVRLRKGGQLGIVVIIVGKYAKVRLSNGVYTFYLADLTLAAKKGRGNTGLED